MKIDFGMPKLDKEENEPAELQAEKKGAFGIEYDPDEMIDEANIELHEEIEQEKEEQIAKMQMSISEK